MYSARLRYFFVSCFAILLVLFGSVGCGDSPQDETDAAQQPDAGVDAADATPSDAGDTADAPDNADATDGGDDGGDDGGTDGGDGGNLQAPTAAFSVAQPAEAGTAVAFDASASTDPSGEDLTYDWSFGDDELGDGQTIAHVFAAAGDYTVTLTVTNTGGLQHAVQETITVDPRPEPATEDLGALVLSGLVTDSAGAPVENADVEVLRANVTAVTDADGRVELTGLDADTKHTVVVDADGFADQVVVVEAPSGATEAYFETMLLARSAATTLSDVEAGASTPEGTDGVSLTLPANALVDENGDVVTGEIRVQMTPLDISGAQILAFPGGFDAVLPDGTSTPILSYGTAEFELTQNGNPVQLAPGKEATVRLPIYVTKNEDGDDLAEGDTIPLWSLDEAAGIWVREGTGTVVASTASPSGWAFEANVGHFSWWNCDIDFDPYLVNPLPRMRDSDGQLTVEFPEGETVLVRGEPLGDGRPRNAATVHVDSAGTVDGLPVPSERDTRLSGFARNGTLRGEVIVNGSAGVLDDIVIPLDPIDSGGNGEMLTLPVDRDAAIDPMDEVDRYSFTASAGDMVRISVDQATGSDLRGQVSVFPLGGIRMQLESFGYDPAHIAQRIPADGEYVIEIAATANAPGAYSLAVELLPQIQLDTHKSGTFGSGGDEDYYIFEASAGTLLSTGVDDSSATHSYIETIDGDILATSFSGSIAEIPSDGFYVLRLWNTDASVLNYEVGLAIVESAPLSFTDSRATATGAIDIRGDQQIYSFTADAEDGLAVSLRGTGASPLVDDPDTEMRVERVGSGTFFDPDSAVQDDSGYGIPNTAISTHLAKLSGSGTDTYVVTVSSQVLGDYELVVDRVAHAAQITVDDDASCAGATTVSVRAALQAIDANGTVNVCDGVYRSEIKAVLLTDGVTIEGATESGVVLETENTGSISLDIYASNATVRNMTIEHVDNQAARFSGDNLVFENLTLQAVDPLTELMDEAIGGSGANPTFRNLTISDAYVGIDHSEQGGIGGLVEDCVISNVTRGVDLEAHSYTVQRNTISPRDDGPNTDAVLLSGGDFTVEDNTINIDLMSDSYAQGTGIRISERKESPSNTVIRGNTISFINEHQSQDTMGFEILVTRTDAEPSILIENNDITLKPTNGGTVLRLLSNDHTSADVYNNVMRNLGYKGIVLESIERANHIGIYNNSFQQASIDTSSSSTNDTFRISASTSTTVTSPALEIVNNIFDANGVTTYGIDFGGGASGMSIDSDYNLWFGYTSVYVDGTSSTGANEIVGFDPQFQSTLLDVAATSPAVDAGADATLYPGVPAVDFAGVSRPAGAGYDIGAYEQ
jgi:PKD repeat protein